MTKWVTIGRAKSYSILFFFAVVSLQSVTKHECSTIPLTKGKYQIVTQQKVHWKLILNNL